MGLSNDLVSQFAKIIKPESNDSKESTLYGTFVIHNGKKYVRLDGSELLTPVEQTATAKQDDRVSVTIKNHTATVTGNYSSPAARSGDVDEISDKIGEYDTLIADKASIENLKATNATVETLVTDNAVIKKDLKAANASIESITADNVKINKTLTANNAAIENLQTTKISSEVADLKYSTIESLNATNGKFNDLSSDYAKFKVATVDCLDAASASIEKLQTDKLDATTADLKYANIDFSNIGTAAIEQFYATSGIIKDLVIGDQTVTGELVGVTIKGDLIEGGTVVADKLVIKGNDGLYYKLNTDGVTTEKEQTNYNSLNGSVITAKSIAATKISVEDLVAFDATIGGFNITNNAIYSGVKSSVGNTTRGIYQDNDGQLAVGDGSNYLKYFKDSDGNYKLEISAASLRFSASDKDLETVLGEKVQKSEIVSEINQSPEKTSIKAEKISLEGIITANDKFKILKDGSMEAVDGKFTGSITSSNASITGGKVEIKVDDENYQGIHLYTGDPYSDGQAAYIRTVIRPSGIYLGRYNGHASSLTINSTEMVYEGAGGNITTPGTISCDTITSTTATFNGNLSVSGTINGRRWYWAGQGGQPTWLWGGNDGANMYVWCPSNFSVNYANSSGAVNAGLYASDTVHTVAGNSWLTTDAFTLPAGRYVGMVFAKVSGTPGSRMLMLLSTDPNATDAGSCHVSDDNNNRSCCTSPFVFFQTGDLTWYLRVYCSLGSAYNIHHGYYIYKIG